jgi:hypothetical protein
MSANICEQREYFTTVRKLAEPNLILKSFCMDWPCKDREIVVVVKEGGRL